ncbi:hypothetical protein [Pengzhenrongella frigida]|uniref:Yip1 domain-containing protein n=1 Tax=Pengzhenrongella frigida TaxID=1259133 RepID=A0A4Q5N0V1_9MICO|nr:hypothetical protein [Cellulomonas sp. HLT2-17]RYV51708.1 hypothetical protein EUA98_07345 [Cellulomonas sp. HLT2-17]
MTPPSASSPEVVPPRPRPARARRRTTRGDREILALGAVALVGWLAFRIVGGHARLAETLFVTWSLSAGQVYAILACSAALPVLAWFELMRVLPLLPWQGLTDRVRPRMRAAALATVPVALLIDAPGKYGASGWSDRLVVHLGYVLGTTEVVASVTILVAALPTLFVTVFLGLWLSSHPGRGWTTAAYVGVVAWLTGVAFLGWAIGPL